MVRFVNRSPDPRDTRLSVGRPGAKGSATINKTGGALAPPGSSLPTWHVVGESRVPISRPGPVGGSGPVLPDMDSILERLVRIIQGNEARGRGSLDVVSSPSPACGRGPG